MFCTAQVPNVMIYFYKSFGFYFKIVENYIYLLQFFRKTQSNNTFISKHLKLFSNVLFL